MNVQAILLTGGKSSRMGRDKSTLPLGNMNFTEHIIGRVSTITKNIMVVGPKEEFKNFNGNFHADLFSDKGPISGILTGLTYSKFDINLILSCDIPLIQSDLLNELLWTYKEQDAFICMNDQRLNPLVGIYHKRSLIAFKTAIIKNILKLTTVLNELHTGHYKVPTKWKDQLTNINSPIEYEKLLNEYTI